jgi:hypothetical protein
MSLQSVSEFLWDPQNHCTTGNHSSKIRKNTTLEMAIVVYLTSSCVNWFFLAWMGPRVPKNPNLHTNELNTRFFCSTSPLKAPNRLKSLKLAWRFVLTSCHIYQNPFTQEKIPKFWQCRTKKIIKWFLKKLKPDSFLSFFFWQYFCCLSQHHDDVGIIAPPHYKIFINISNT